MKAKNHIDRDIYSK